MAGKARKEKSDLLTIGVIARSFGVNENTIRRLEAAGLLKPAHISPGSGYRYYDSDNVSLLTEIFALRSCGFVYEDLIEYYRTPGDFSNLYNKLIIKKASLEIMAERLKRRMNTPDFLKERLIQYREADCLSREMTMIPDADGICAVSKSLLYESIRAGQPIDYTRSVIILSECEDYRRYRWDIPQKLTFCIPLRQGENTEGTLHIPAGSAVSCGCSDPDRGLFFRESMEIIDRTISERGLHQSDTLRLTWDICGNIGSDGALGDKLLYLVVPVD